MIDVQHQLDLLLENSEWGCVLEAYQAESKRLAAAPKSDDAEERAELWVPRLRRVDEFEAEQLSEIHGKLIAWGFLKFHLESRETGIQYQLTQLGRHALTIAANATPPADNDEVVEAIAA